AGRLTRVPGRGEGISSQVETGTPPLNKLLEAISEQRNMICELHDVVSRQENTIEELHRQLQADQHTMECMLQDTKAQLALESHRPGFGHDCKTPWQNGTLRGGMKGPLKLFEEILLKNGNGR
ncbi:hypothetical protein BR93DRAFT_886599, partial [Coniochaeta sp. PMI_546]